MRVEARQNVYRIMFHTVLRWMLLSCRSPFSEFVHGCIRHSARWHATALNKSFRLVSIVGPLVMRAESERPRLAHCRAHPFFCRRQVLSLQPFSSVRSVSPLEVVLTPPVAVENLGKVAAGGVLGLIPSRVLSVDDINRLAKDL